MIFFNKDAQFIHCDIITLQILN